MKYTTQNICAFFHYLIIIHVLVLVQYWSIYSVITGSSHDFARNPKLPYCHLQNSEQTAVIVRGLKGQNIYTSDKSRKICGWVGDSDQL